MRFLLIFILAFGFINLFSQEEYKFDEIVKLKYSPVRNQGNTGTCWSFATTSFLESEILRANSSEVDISEMFFVRKAYEEKAINSIRYQGKTNFSQGGQAHDVINVAKKYGIVPEPNYNGLPKNKSSYNHDELENMLISVLKVFIENKTGSLIDDWKKIVDVILDTYIGKIPNSFTFNSMSYSPDSYRDALSLNFDDYIEITSYSHHEYYKKICLEIPDNWSRGLYYNVPLSDLIEIMNYSINSGYTFVWDGDVSEKEFNHKKRIAILPEKNWDDKSIEEKQNTCVNIEKEKTPSQEDRQGAFNNYTSTDDHLMHIVGLAKDQNGTKYFITKNSWGCESNEIGGLLYMSENYCRKHTVAILVNKKAIPERIAKLLK